MKIKILTGLLLISTITVFGQNHFLGLKGGINWTNVNSSSDRFLTSSKNRTGFSCGLTYDYYFTEKLNLEIDILYAQKGFKNDIEFIDSTGNRVGVKAFNDFNYDYLSFPIKFGYTIGKSISGFANLGVIPSFLVDAETIISLFDGYSTLNTTDKVTKFDLAGIIEIGGNYKFNIRYLLFLSIAYEHSFTTFTNSNYFEYNEGKHYGITLSMGLKYAIRNE